jgi:hypothetical protein
MRAAHDTEVQPAPGIAYSVRSGTTPEMERAALANIYSFVLRCANKNAPGVDSTKGDDTKGSKNDRAKTSIHE